MNAIPNVHGAMFAMLPPGAKLGAHRDPFAGSLRYHLGLVTPNSDDCFIIVDGEKCVWRDGEAIMFDETFIHTAENRTDQNRIILFCDVERPMRFGFMRAMNCWVSEQSSRRHRRRTRRARRSAWSTSCSARSTRFTR